MLTTTAFTALSVVVMSGASLLPYFSLKKSGSSSSVRCFSSGLIASCNCFACGVFLATCFLGLIPHTKMSENAVHRSYNVNVSNGSITSTFGKTLISSELMVLFGILLMLLIEQIFSFCYQLLACGQHTSSNNYGNHSTLLNDAYYSKRSTNSATSMISFSAPSFAEHCRNGKNGMSQKLNHNKRVDLKRLKGDFEPLVNMNDLIEGEMSTDEELERNGDDNDDEFSSILQSKFLFESNESRLTEGEENSGALQLVMLLLAMSTHSVFEGFALSAEQNVDEFLRLLLSVMLHEVLCCFSFGISLSAQNVSPRTAALSTFFLALSIPAGMFIMMMVGSLDGFNALVIKFVLEGLSAGIFIYVACVEMLAPEFGGTHAHCGDETTLSHLSKPRNSLFKALLVCLGALVAFLFGMSVHKLR